MFGAQRWEVLALGAGYSKGSPGVEFSKALLSTVMAAQFEILQASRWGNAAPFLKYGEHRAVGETMPGAAAPSACRANMILNMIPAIHCQRCRVQDYFRQTIAAPRVPRS